MKAKNLTIECSIYLSKNGRVLKMGISEIKVSGGEPGIILIHWDTNEYARFNLTSSTSYNGEEFLNEKDAKNHAKEYVSREIKKHENEIQLLKKQL